MLPPTPIGGRVDPGQGVFFSGSWLIKLGKLGNHVSGTLGYLAIHYVQDPNFGVRNVCIYIYMIYINTVCVYIYIYICHIILAKLESPWF